MKSMENMTKTEKVMHFVAEGCFYVAATLLVAAFVALVVIQPDISHPWIGREF